LFVLQKAVKQSSIIFYFIFSFFIERSCFSYKTYRLEEVTSTKILVKRSADNQGEPLKGFVEFAGKSLIKYNIINLDEIQN
jgi:hypothetical protein